MTDRGECPICGKQIALTKDGRLRGHGGTIPCQGRARFPAKKKPPRTPEQERSIERARRVMAIRGRADALWAARNHNPALLGQIGHMRAALDSLEALIHGEENT